MTSEEPEGKSFNNTSGWKILNINAPEFKPKNVESEKESNNTVLQDDNNVVTKSEMSLSSNVAVPTFCEYCYLSDTIPVNNFNVPNNSSFTFTTYSPQMRYADGNSYFYLPLTGITPTQPNLQIYLSNTGEVDKSTSHIENSTYIQTGWNTTSTTTIAGPTVTPNVTPNTGPFVYCNQTSSTTAAPQLQQQSIYNNNPRLIYFARPGANPYSQTSAPTILTTINTCNTTASNVLDIRKKHFNTGNPQLDKQLNQIVKTINPTEEFVFQSENVRFFVVKSFTEDHIYLSLHYGVWCSTPNGNDMLCSAFRNVQAKFNKSDPIKTEPHVYLFFSVNGSGYFCGVAEMKSELLPLGSSGYSGSNSDCSNTSTPNSNNSQSGGPGSNNSVHFSGSLWQQKKWQGQFQIRWLYVKDVANAKLRHIRLEHNENRPVTNSRDATEIKPIEKGIEMLKIFHHSVYETCLLNDFENVTSNASQIIGGNTSSSTNSNTTVGSNTSGSFLTTTS